MDPAPGPVLPSVASPGHAFVQCVRFAGEAFDRVPCESRGPVSVIFKKSGKRRWTSAPGPALPSVASPGHAFEEASMKSNPRENDSNYN